MTENITSHWQICKWYKFYLMDLDCGLSNGGSGSLSLIANIRQSLSFGVERIVDRNYFVFIIFVYYIEDNLQWKWFDSTKKNTNNILFVLNKIFHCSSNYWVLSWVRLNRNKYLHKSDLEMLIYILISSLMSAYW